MKLEIDMVVEDALGAAEFYKDLFNAKILSKTDLDKNSNEAMVIIAGTEIRILNENKDYNLFAPSKDMNSAMWINLFVDDIESLFKKAIDMDCTSIQPVTKFEEVKVKNAVFSDKYNHVWVLNQNLE
jgi:PhnB protein